MITYQVIQSRLKEAIKLSGLTESVIAEKLEIPYQSYYDIIYGHQMPTLDIIANLCNILNADANYILCLE